MTIGFDTSPLIYQALVYTVTVGLGGWLYWIRNSRFPEKLFLGISAFYLLFLRLPVLVFNRELNADESQMLAQALTLSFDPVYWRSVDGTTGGPLSSYFLIPLGYLFNRFDYVTAHCSALLLVCFTLFFLFKALKNWFGPYRAALGIMPVILFYGFTKHPDFVHYTSEHTPIALLALSIWMVSSHGIIDGPRRTHAILLGSFLTLVPFGKIQAVPLAAAVGVYACYKIITKKRWDNFKWTVFGSIATLLFILLLLLAGGVLEAFYNFYIKGNLIYKNDSSFWSNLGVLFHSLIRAPDLLILFIPLVLSIVVSHKDENRRKKDIIVLGLGLLVATVYASARTGSGYTHYLLFLILPVSVLMGSYTPSQLGKRLALRACVVPVAVAIIASFIVFRQRGAINSYPTDAGQNKNMPMSETSKAAKKVLTYGDFIVVWGWNCQYYVECQAPQGVAENHSIRSAYEHPLRDTYRAKYMSDIARNRPVVFIDAVGPNSLWLQDTLTQTYRSFPELANYIDQYYVLAGKPEGNRMFVRSDIYQSKQE